jgi:hypothetical protein
MALLLRSTSSCTIASYVIAYCIMLRLLGLSKVSGFIKMRHSLPFLHRTSTSIAGANKGVVDDHLANSTDRSDTVAHLDKRTYLSNPAVTATALAHAIWKSVVIPFTDTVIDATCGNGKDSIVLSNLLFNLESDVPRSQVDTYSQFTPQLLCIDIQQRACENTFHSLSKHIQDPFILQNYIRILNSSHDPLPRPSQEGSVGLVCYNLGYLPGLQDKVSFTTQTHSTISSIKDAAIMLRVGGLLSITIYPKSNSLEADAVRFFCEGLAKISSKNDDGCWKDMVIPTTLLLENGTNLQDAILSAIQAVVSKNMDQSWRVFEHKPLGRSSSPTLITALRIK